MSYTPVELRHVRVGRSLFGYNRATVEQLIDEVAQSFEATWRERGELADQVESLEKQLERAPAARGAAHADAVAAEQAASRRPRAGPPRGRDDHLRGAQRGAGDRAHGPVRSGSGSSARRGGSGDAPFGARRPRRRHGRCGRGEAGGGEGRAAAAAGRGGRVSRRCCRPCSRSRRSGRSLPMPGAEDTRRVEPIAEAASPPPETRARRAARRGGLDGDRRRASLPTDGTAAPVLQRIAGRRVARLRLGRIAERRLEGVNVPRPGSSFASCPVRRSLASAGATAPAGRSGWRPRRRPVGRTPPLSRCSPRRPGWRGGMSRSSSGETARDKVVTLSGIAPAELERRLSGGRRGAGVNAAETAEFRDAARTRT